MPKTARISSQTHYDLITLVKINIKIKHLIEAKYPEPGKLQNLNTFEGKYYRQLCDELDKVQSALREGGLAVKVVEVETQL
jgi:hypothetical protein